MDVGATSVSPSEINVDQVGVLAVQPRGEGRRTARAMPGQNPATIRRNMDYQRRIPFRVAASKGEWSIIGPQFISGSLRLRPQIKCPNRSTKCAFLGETRHTLASLPTLCNNTLFKPPN